MLYKIICRVICLMGCMYQTYRICELYFSYETTTSVKYKLEDKINVPGLTLCFEKSTVLKQDFIIKHNINNMTSPFEKLYFLNHWPIKDQFTFIKEPDNIFTCKIVSNN